MLVDWFEAETSMVRNVDQSPAAKPSRTTPLKELRWSPTIFLRLKILFPFITFLAVTFRGRELPPEFIENTCDKHDTCYYVIECSYRAATRDTMRMPMAQVMLTLLLRGFDDSRVGIRRYSVEMFMLFVDDIDDG